MAGEIWMFLPFPEIGECTLYTSKHLGTKEGGGNLKTYKEQPACERSYGILAIRKSYLESLLLPSISSRRMSLPPIFKFFRKLRNLCSMFKEACMVWNALVL